MSHSSTTYYLVATKDRKYHALALDSTAALCMVQQQVGDTAVPLEIDGIEIKVEVSPAGSVGPDGEIVCDCCSEEQRRESMVEHIRANWREMIDSA